MNHVRESPATTIRSLLQTAAAVQAHLEARLSPIGLSMPKLAALMALRDAGESLPLSHLADRLSCVKSNITQLVDRLETDGFVRREADPNDRRSRVAVLTTAGRVACDLGSRTRAEAERDLMAGFSAEEAERFTAALEAVALRAG
ncbi:MAG TPA: MarR family transcriptional regulator [Vicinamibacterales bacterium]